MKDLPYYDKYLKQGSRCPVCAEEITPQEYCVINTPRGIMVIHRQCMSNVKIIGCYAQVEVVTKANSNICSNASDS